MNLQPQVIIDASYFAAAFLFIYGLKRMSSPVTARSGIVVAGAGMLVAVLASFLYYFGVNPAALPHLGENFAYRDVARRDADKRVVKDVRRLRGDALP